MIDDVLTIAKHVASILDRSGERKYKEQILEIRRKLSLEEMKSEPDDLAIHFLRADLRNLLSVFANELESRRYED